MSIKQMAAWVRENCRFALDSREQGPLVGDPRVAKPPAAPRMGNPFPSPVAPSPANIQALIKKFEETQDPAIQKQLAAMGLVKTKAGAWVRTRQASKLA